MAPSPTRRVDLLLSILGFALISFSLLTKLAGTVWLSRHSLLEDAREYNYADGNYPETWPVTRPRVLMASDATRRFRLNTTEGEAEWSAIVPGDGLVHLGASWEPYTISMVHQLRCLGILRRDVMREGDASEGPTALGRHCLNYLKQMVLCRGDLQLEAMQYKSHKDPIDLLGIYECRDWGAVYDAVRKNQQEYQRRCGGCREV